MTVQDIIKNSNSAVRELESNGFICLGSTKNFKEVLVRKEGCDPLDFKDRYFFNDYIEARNNLLKLK